MGRHIKPGNLSKTQKRQKKLAAKVGISEVEAKISGNVPHRPRLFTSPDHLLELFNGYQTNQANIKEPLTMLGLTTYLGISHSTLLKYEKDKPEFQVVIQHIRDAIGSNIISGAMKNRYNNAMSIFVMKNLHNWSDKREERSEQNINIVVETRIPDRSSIAVDAVEAEYRSSIELADTTPTKETNNK